MFYKIPVRGSTELDPTSPTGHFYFAGDRPSLLWFDTRPLLSNLAFEGDYIEKLVELVFGDTMARAEEIRSFVDR
jgi:hypothetical protein